MSCMSKITADNERQLLHISFCHTITFKLATKGGVYPKTAKFEVNQRT